MRLTEREEASQFAKLKGFSVAKLHSYGEALSGCGPVDPSIFTAYGLWDYMCVNHDQYTLLITDTLYTRIAEYIFLVSNLDVK